ncbi:hypothetical protein FK268_12825 [Tsukamurella sputi]|uniref:Uncharacterized protein n=1 Tax=Tsukamurella sputi TaxID=2591848 RepID=A0A5C5RJT3_9ACTN|nr:hypothetical protein [Tsukamurella sputi]TWS23197.1 hypothetical protein FK268_12825 [Tsukamurella sputi]
MAEINTIDGESEGAGLCKWKFAGSPEDMFEHHPKVGEIRVLTITVECTSTGTEKLASGTRQFANFKVRETNVGTAGTLKGMKGTGEIPGQTSIEDELGDEPRPDLGDYRPDEPGGDWVPPADQVGKDGEGRAPDNVRGMFSDPA